MVATQSPDHNVRLDLQGIRGWAVIAVVIFHFFPSLLPFGYLGVDVFFVLSGFLIALVLDRPPPFAVSTYISFYFRRLRRIFPLLLLVVLLVLVYSVLLYDGSHLYYATRSVLYSLGFASNFKSQDKGEDYFMMLEEASDFLTHTWSLAVEIQFYCLAPFIFCIGKKLFGDRGWPLVPYLLLLSFLSLCYHILSDSSTAFNSVFARLWQFLLGSAVFQIQNSWCLYLPVSETEAVVEQKTYHKEKVISAVIVALMIPIVLFKADKVLYIRILVTALTAILILANSCTVLLTGRAIVLMGDISYSLYLIHWPAVCLLHEYKLMDIHVEMLAIAMCIFLSYLSYNYYEKWYLTLNEQATLSLIALLYFIAFAIMASTKGTHISFVISEYFGNSLNQRASNSLLLDLAYSENDWHEEMKREINLTTSMAINGDYERNWMENLRLNCTMTDNPWGLCQAEKGNGSLRFFSIGNSYNSNIGRLVQKHFKRHYSDFDYFTISSCMAIHSFANESGCENVELLEEARKHIHDVVFVIQRFIQPNWPVHRIEEDQRFLDMLRMVNEYGKTAKKVFVLNAIPRPLVRPGKIQWCTAMNRSYGCAAEVEAEATFERMRLDEIAKRCSNCVLFDVYQRHIDKDGNFVMIHPHTHIELFETSMHYTPYGLRLIEPVFKRMSEQFPQLMESKYPHNVFSLEESGFVDKVTIA